MRSKREKERNELRAILHVLQAPALAPLGVVAGYLGIEDAIEICGTHELTGQLLSVFATAGWTLDHLPSQEDARLAILGARCAWQLELNKRRQKALPLQTLCRGICSFDEARKALKLLDRYGASVIPVHRDLKAL